MVITLIPGQPPLCCCCFEPRNSQCPKSTRLASTDRWSARPSTIRYKLAGDSTPYSEGTSPIIASILQSRVTKRLPGSWGAVGPLLHGKGPIIAKPNKGGSPTKDLLVTHLSHPRSGPAPPASPEVIRNLERRTVDRDLLRMKVITDCSICTDEMQLRQSVTFLRCKHWLHERCIISWRVRFVATPSNGTK
ncbi:RING finger domain protein [Metarhizium robertsii]|uniref:RING finger domain protein n=1 Tax=Metarhizium robertsii TaxID=568076 RepID=A0A0A1UP62_9HYPO|nr:RING finger domain protein [Metarhizium robertsii]